MSASEKLKALGKRDMRDVGKPYDLLDALPQIVAVVEAAERVSTARMYAGTAIHEPTADEFYPTYGALAVEALAPALSALDEALA